MQTSNEQALKHYQQTLLRNPKDLQAQIQCGNLCVELQRFEEAAGYFRRLVRILNTNVDVANALCYALQALGNQSHAQGRYTMAEACFAEALQYQPNNAAHWYNRGNAQRELGQANAALGSFKQAIQFDPNDADAYNNLGNVQRELGLLDLAILSYETALKLNPKLYHAKVHCVHQKQHICDWQGLQADIAEIREWIKTIPHAQISPFAFLAMPGTTAEEQKLCANNWVNNRYASLMASHVGRVLTRQEISMKLVGLKPDLQKTKIKIGYLSADFRLHPLAFLISELIELHNRSTFEIVAFSYGVNDNSSARARLEKAFDAFVDIRNLSDTEAAQKIQACEIDILVDLTGFTQTSRTGIAALRPAPINVNWLGFAGTMGNASNGKPLFDYILTDPFVTPPETAQYYAEKLVFLPCYQPNDSKRPIEKTPTRTACGLHDEAFVFCCFNQTFKITPEVFTVWMRLLKAVPNSVLWLLDCNAWAKQNLTREAASAGVSADKLIFAPRVSVAEHLARHAHADLFLDTLPYNAHTTCSDALWMDVPVLTCVGDTFSARVAGSLLSALNLNELITYQLQHYENKAIYFANNRHELSSLRQKIIQNKQKSALFNTHDFVQSLEAAYQSMLAKKSV